MISLNAKNTKNSECTEAGYAAGTRDFKQCGDRSTWMRMSPTTSFVDPELLQPYVLDADHASNETVPAHRLALLNPKLDLATTGAEPELHHGDLLLFGNHLRISRKS